MLFALLALATSRPLIENKKVGDSSQACVFCKFYASMIEDMFLEGEGLEEIIEGLEGLCDYVAASVKELCEKTVETMTPVVVEYLEKQLPPSEICKLISLCKD